MMCERALSRETAGQPAGRQAVRAGLHRRLLRAARSSSGSSCSTRRGRSTSTTTTSGSARTSRRPRWSCPRCCTTSPGGPCRCTARSGTTNEMPFFGMIHGAGVMGLADGPTEVHKVTVARQVLRDYTGERRHLADAVAAQAAGGGQGQVRRVPRARGGEPVSDDRRDEAVGDARRSPTSTSWPPGWTPRASASGRRSSTATSRAAARTRSTSCAGATCTAPCASRRPARRRRRDEGIVREWRIIEALDGTDVPHTEAIAVCTDPSVLGRTFYLMGFVDGWSPMSTRRQWPAPFDTDLEERRGLAFQLVEGIALLSQGRLAGQGPGGPGPARRLPRAPGRPLDRVPRAHQGPRAARASTRRRPGCGPTGRSTSSPGSCTATTSSPTSCSSTARRPAWPPSWTGRWAPWATPSSTWAGSCSPGPRTPRTTRTAPAATST